MMFDKKRLCNMYMEILCQQNISKFNDYFVENCYIAINGKKFTTDTFKERMLWIKKNFKEVDIKILNYFPSKDDQWITDLHLTTSIDNQGKEHKILVMQQAKISKNRISTFFDVSYLLDKNQLNAYIVNAH